MDYITVSLGLKIAAVLIYFYWAKMSGRVIYPGDDERRNREIVVTILQTPPMLLAVYSLIFRQF